LLFYFSINWGFKESIEKEKIKLFFAFLLLGFFAFTGHP